jgi:hypothetical protein
MLHEPSKVVAAADCRASSDRATRSRPLLVRPEALQVKLKALYTRQFHIN